MVISLKCLTRPIAVCLCVLTAITSATAQRDQQVSLDGTLTARRVLHVNGGFMPPFHDPGRSERPGDEGDTRRHSHECRALAAV